MTQEEQIDDFIAENLKWIIDNTNPKGCITQEIHKKAQSALTTLRNKQIYIET